MKYQRIEDGGLADRDPGRVLWEEKQRQDWLCGFKLGMSRLVWDDVLPPAWADTERRVLREAMETRARFGDDVSDLEPFIIREPRRRRS